MPPSDLATRADVLLLDLCQRFPMGYVPRISWRPYRVTAGMAYYESKCIGLSTIVLRDEKALAETVIHEYAHLLAVHRKGRRGRGHGEAWRLAMRDLGLEPKIRHCYVVKRNASRQQVDYQCVRCGAVIARKRRLPRRRRYVHATCGGDLKLLRILRVIAPRPTS